MSVVVEINATALGDAIVGPLTQWFIAIVASIGSIAVTVVGAIVHSVATRNSKCSMSVETFGDMRKELSSDLQELAAAMRVSGQRAVPVTTTPSAAVGTEPNVE